MAVANDPYVGAWKIVEVISLCGSGCQSALEGTEMKLDESGDVTWILPEGSESDCALFRCEVYDLVTDHSYNNDRRSLMLAAVQGHVVVFKVDHPTPQDLMVLTCEAWCILQCQRVPCRQPPPDHPFSLAPLIGCSVYSDVAVTAADGSTFAAHSQILRLLAPSIDWRADPLRHLPAPAVRAVLHYLYTESLPEGLAPTVAAELQRELRQLPELGPLAELCGRYLTNVTLRDDLRRLVADMLSCCRAVNGALSEAVGRPRQGAESVLACPSQLSALARLCLQQMALGLSKLALTFDLYGHHEMALGSEERREIIRYAQSRLPQFLTELQRMLHGLRTLLSSASQTQRSDLAARSVSELEWLAVTISTLLEESKTFLEAALGAMTAPDGPAAARRDGSLTYVLRSRTMLCLQTLLERLTRANIYILQKREYLSAVGEAGGARLVARSTERLLDELPALMACAALDEAAELAGQHVTWREFKFYFIATASRVHHIMELLRQHAEVVRPLIDHIRLLVGGEQLDATLVRLGLLEDTLGANQEPGDSAAANHSAGDNGVANRRAGDSAATNQETGGGETTNQSVGSGVRTNQMAGNGGMGRLGVEDPWKSNCSSSPASNDSDSLSLVSALTRPPLSRDSGLARRCHQLFESGRDTDLQFTVRGDPVVPSLLGGHGAAISGQQETVLLAHGPVVAARSSWLRRVLTSGMKESIDRQVSICDASPAIFRSMLEFVYCGHVTPENWPPEQLMELLVLADRYELDDLKHSCEALLETHIDEDSVCCLLSIAEQYNARKLKSSALEFVATNPEVVQSELFLELGPALQAEVEETAVWAPP
ncbi:uncharacterized protein LOC122367893, partial [Amphibalanus amphitrite]|uniref:uncharacterized protein LOC122367893 n=1 Tax=Amphibalanus amphitrite TaxID=1232801 RepID=UPI001C8FE3EC